MVQQLKKKQISEVNKSGMVLHYSLVMGKERIIFQFYRLFPIFLQDYTNKLCRRL